ncbi:MAG: hypothetical protein NC127_00180 [Muribaculum sp.]|nr:hypothetical protein [Muribaculum sp.]
MKLRRLNNLKSALCIFLLLAISGCSDKNDDLDPKTKPDNSGEEKYQTKSEHGEGYDITYRFNNNVIVINDSNVDYLIRIESDTILYFSSSTPSALLPAKGEIISSGITDKTPDGLGNKVLDIESVNGEFKCVTTSAPLDEIFAELSLNMQDYELTSTDEIEAEDPTGNKFIFSFVTPEDAEAVSKSTKTPIINREVESKGGLSYEFKFNVTPTFSLKLDPFHPENNMVDFKTDFTFSGELGLSGKKTFTTPILTLPRINFPIIQVGPITLHPYLEGGVNFVAEAEGSFNISFSKTISYRAGYKDGEKFCGREDNSDDDNIVRGINVNVRGKMGVEAELALGVGIIIPQASVGGKISAEALFSTDFLLNNPNLFIESPSLNFDINYAFSLFAKLEFDRIFKFKGEKRTNDDSDRNTKFGTGIEVILPELTVLHREWPLIPRLESGSLKVSDKINGDTYTMRYNLEESLLSKFFDFTSGAKVFLDGNELYHLTSNKTIPRKSTSSHNFNLSNLDPDEYYKACPTLTMFGKVYEHKLIKFPEASIVGSWKYTDKDHEYYLIETFSSDGSYRYNEYDLESNELMEWGSGTYIYDDKGSLLVTSVTSGDDAPFKMWALCTVKKNEMYYEDLDDEKHRKRIYHRLNMIEQ